MVLQVKGSLEVPVLPVFGFHLGLGYQLRGANRAAWSPWEDPKSRSTLNFFHLHHRSTRVQNRGIYFLDPPGGLGA